MSHDHHNHTHPHVHDKSSFDQKLNTAFKLSLILNLVFVMIEFFFSKKTQSLSLLSDALHNLSDVFVLLSSFLAQYLIHKNKFKKLSALLTITNCLVLFGTIFYILFESYHRSRSPLLISETHTIMLVAFLGILINLGSGLLFKNHHQHLNAQAAYLHLIADAAISLSVIISAFIISKTGFTLLDIILSILISLFLFYSTTLLFIKALRNYQSCT